MSGQTWALHVDVPVVSALLVIETSPDEAPMVHAVASIRRGASPGAALAAQGWSALGAGWLPRSWGAVAAVEPLAG